MKILLFGPATGTGRHIVEQALKQGHEVTAFLHDHSSPGIHHPKLRILRSHILDESAVNSAMRKQDAVICALEAVPKDNPKFLSEATANIIKAMEANRVKRFVCLSTVGVLGSDAPLLHRHVIIPLFKKHEFADKRRQIEEIMHSDLDWIVVRHVKLTDGPRKHRYHFSLVRPIGSKIPRANVADFMIKQLFRDRFLREMLIVSE